MMKSVILLLMILGVGGWVLSHSASYIAHRRAAHGPLTPRLFSWKLRDTPAFRQALEETIVFLDNRRDWAAGSALDAGTTDLCWIEIKDRDLLLRAGLFSPGNLGRLQIRRRLPLLPSGALPLSGSEAAQLTHFLLAALQVYYRGAPRSLPPAPGVSVRTSPLSMALQSTKRARGPIRRSGPALLQYGHRITFPHWKGFGCSLPLTETYVWFIIIHMFDFKGGRPHGPDGQADHPGGRRQV